MHLSRRVEVLNLEQRWGLKEEGRWNLITGMDFFKNRILELNMLRLGLGCWLFLHLENVVFTSSKPSHSVHFKEQLFFKCCGFFLCMTLEIYTYFAKNCM